MKNKRVFALQKNMAALSFHFGDTGTFPHFVESPVALRHIQKNKPLKIPVSAQ